MVNRTNFIKQELTIWQGIKIALKIYLQKETVDTKHITLAKNQF